MSGPKIVDVRAVRAQEERAWRSLRRQLELACGRFATLSKTPGAQVEISAEELQKTLARLDEKFAQSRPSQRLTALVEEGQAQLVFIDDLRQHQSDGIARHLLHRRELREATEEAARRLQSSGHPAEARSLRNAPAGAANLESALALLASDSRKADALALQAATRELAGSPVTAPSITDWIATRAKERDASEVRLEKLAASLAAQQGLEEAETWLARIEALREIADPAARRLRTDSLVLELNDLMRTQTAEQRRQQQLDDLDARLIPFGEANELRAQVDALRNRAAADVKPLEAQVNAWVEAAAKKQDGARARSAVLTALRELGYDVREGMATAWTEQGRLVVQQPGQADYGVEVSTLAGDKLRTRLVRFSDSPETTAQQRQRDVEVEGTWCQSHAKVLSQLSAAGLDAKLIAARAVGETPVAVLSQDEAPAGARTALMVPVSQARTLGGNKT